MVHLQELPSETPRLGLWMTSGTPKTGGQSGTFFTVRQPAKEDRYGRLYVCRDVLRLFLDRLATANVSFKLYCLNARELKILATGTSIRGLRYVSLQNYCQHPTSRRSPTFRMTATLDVARHLLAFRTCFSRLIVIRMQPSSLFYWTLS
jgi:hypothetical protein